MSIPNGVTKLTFSGTMNSGVEKWACSLFFTGFTQPPADGSLDPAGLDSSTQWSAFITALCAMNLPTFAVSAYDVYYYEGGEAVSHVSAVVNHAGTGSTTAGHPNQVAIVMTLRTALATRSGRGRVYLPYTSGAVLSTGLASSTLVNTCVDALAAYLSAVELTSPQLPVVVSQTHSSTATITSVDADLVPDTQRRRRNKLTSPRHSSPVSPD